VETSADRYTGLSEPVPENVSARRAEVVDFGLPVAAVNRLATG